MSEKQRICSTCALQPVNQISNITARKKKPLQGISIREVYYMRTGYPHPLGSHFQASHQHLGMRCYTCRYNPGQAQSKTRMISCIFASSHTFDNSISRMNLLKGWHLCKCALKLYLLKLLLKIVKCALKLETTCTCLHVRPCGMYV